MVEGGGGLVSNEIAKALGELKDPRAVEPLMEKASELPSAITTLVEIGDERCIDAIIKALDSQDADSGENIREEAASALLQMSSLRIPVQLKKEIAAVRNSKSRERLESLAGRDHIYIRCTAIRRLGEMDSKKSLSRIMQFVDSKEDCIRKSAMVAVCRIGGKQTLDLLDRALYEGKGDVHLAAVDALTKMKGEAAEIRIRNLLNGKDSDKRESGLRVLAEKGNKKDAKRVTAFLNDPNPQVRGSAVMALGEIGTKKHILVPEKSRGKEKRRILASDDQYGQAGKDESLRRMNENVDRAVKNIEARKG